MKEFTKAVRGKGWTLKEVARRWNKSERRIAQIASQPRQEDWDKIHGLPEKTN